MKKKHCKFNASFRQAAVRVAKELKLKFCSTRRQVENGTLMFKDRELKNVMYSLHESGYVRRHTLNRWSWVDRYDHYQLNKTTKAERYVYINPQKTLTVKDTVRILAGPEEQLGILVKAVVNYRKRFL
jgi:hypothetical protein